MLQLKSRAVALAMPPPSAAATAAPLALAERNALLLGADGVDESPSRASASAAVAFVPLPALAPDIVSVPNQATEGRETRRTRSHSTYTIDRYEAHEKKWKHMLPDEVH